MKSRLGKAMAMCRMIGKRLRKETGYRLRMARLPRVYIAGPISKGDLWRNVEKGIRVYNRLLDAGYEAYLPHFNVYADRLKRRSWADWMKIDAGWLKLCDVVWRIEGDSVGADCECKAAGKLGMPVVRTMGELKEVRVWGIKR